MGSLVNGPCELAGLFNEGAGVDEAESLENFNLLMIFLIELIILIIIPIFQPYILRLLNQNRHFFQSMMSSLNSTTEKPISSLLTFLLPLVIP